MMTIFCALFTWTILISFIYSIIRTWQKGINYVKTLHQIPCCGCEYFTNDYRLKCTVHPTKACTNEACDCIDYEPKTCSCNARAKEYFPKSLKKFTDDALS